MSFDFGKIIGRGDPTKKSEAVLAYNERRFYQMATFYSLTIATYIASKIAYRGIIARRYTPNFYQHNHVPPKFSFYKDAMSAVTHASLLSVTSMGMATTGAFWYFDISNMKEFTSRMKVWLGGDEAERELRNMPEDETTKEITESLDSILRGDFFGNEGEEEKK
ncbi:Aim11 protein [Martiniozyma asiatica (nom. inval.)]|nr:Aim11 protein [Martiniozyma asiatica]